MKHIIVGFVILHYNNIEDTVETIESIVNRIDTNDYHIVVVDNASPNSSGGVLVSKYKYSSHTTVVLNSRNLGFSAGNNIGIKYLRSNFEIDFVILSNNDIILHDLCFSQKVLDTYEKSHFAAMGPMILTGGGRCDANPISDVPYSKEDSLKEIAEYEFFLKLEKYGLLRKYFVLDYYLRKLVKSYREKHKSLIVKSYEPGLYLKQRVNVVIHGCFMILSREYFKFFEGLDERTFMYSEENILFQHLNAKGLTMLYNPDIVIYHKEGASVRKMYNNSTDSMHFKFVTKIKSHKAYIALLDELKS